MVAVQKTVLMYSPEEERKATRKGSRMEIKYLKGENQTY
jgi:hypothetical protein